MPTLQQLPERIRKDIRLLHHKRNRDTDKKFIAEGPKIIEELSRSNYTPEVIVVRNDVAEEMMPLLSVFLKSNVPVYTANPYHFEFISDAKTPQGIVAVVRYPEQENIDDTSFIALDGINDPGNVGTIIRTAHWFGINNIVLSKGSVDKFNPKVVRATMGSLFHCNVIETDVIEFASVKRKSHTIFGATLEATLAIEDCSPKGKFGIVIGSESHGISNELRKKLTHEYTIIGAGDAESLNAAVAAGISLFHFSMFIK